MLRGFVTQAGAPHTPTLPDVNIKDRTRMDTFVRNALRISLAGAGIVVLGASYVGQASADEDPDSASNSASPSTSEEAPGSLIAMPDAEELLAPDSLDTMVIPTVADMTGL